MIKRSMVEKKEEEDLWEVVAKMLHRPELAKLKGKVKWKTAMKFEMKNDL